MAIDERTRQIILDRHEWLEDVIAGLMINGVKRKEIMIVHDRDASVRVFVRGVAKYIWRLECH